MKVVIDQNIPFLEGVLDGFADVVFLPASHINAETVQDADALIIRTRTHCTRELLQGSRVRFIATATIGYDHIDTDYCEATGIDWVSCPGCNAQAVCDYVEEALREVFPTLSQNSGKAETPTSIGIVGVGHVGTLVAQMAGRMGLQVVLNDPPKGMLGDVRACDIITFHVPLTHEGQYPTFHLCDASFLKHLENPQALIINAARGGIVDEEALLQSGHPCIIDCWENEPHINLRLLHSERTLRASCHIAGYSVAGKRNASQMCLDALCRHFQLPSLTISNTVLPQGDNTVGWLNRLTCQLRKNPTQFEELRREYPLR